MLLKAQIARLHVSLELAFLVRSQMMLMLLVQGPHKELLP